MTTAYTALAQRHMVKNVKHDISATIWLIWIKFCTVMHTGLPDINGCSKKIWNKVVLENSSGKVKHGTYSHKNLYSAKIVK